MTQPSRQHDTLDRVENTAQIILSVLLGLLVLGVSAGIISEIG